MDRSDNRESTIRSEIERQAGVLRTLVSDFRPEMRDAALFAITQIEQWFGTLSGEVTKLHDELERTKKILAQVVSEKAEPEKRIADLAARLQAAQAELESLSYSVSHDLRSPLRTIWGFANLLRAEGSPDLSQSSRYAEVIAKAATRMSDLIDDLLTFSRLGLTMMQPSHFGMDELVKEVVQQVARPIEGRQIDWQIDSLPQVWGDPAMLRQVWLNLLSNSVKFTRSRERARIQVYSTATNENEFEFSVHDNGVGFDASLSYILFRPFQRLHSETEFEGTGIGLAICRRIIERHRGRIWAESKIGEGSTFYFTLPVGRSANS